MGHGFAELRHHCLYDFRVPTFWDTEFEPCPDHRDKHFHTPLATTLAISFACAIWQPRTKTKMHTHGSTCQHVITCMFRYPPGRTRSIIMSRKGRTESGEDQFNMSSVPLRLTVTWYTASARSHFWEERQVYLSCNHGQAAAVE